MGVWVNYLILGTISSEQEFQRVVANIKAPGAKRRRVRELVEFLNMVSNTEELGVAFEAKRWLHTAADSTVKLYYRQPRSGEAGIWAAVAVADDEVTVTMLKIVDTYGGGDGEQEELLADALHRKSRGTITQGLIV